MVDNVHSLLLASASGKSNAPKALAEVDGALVHVFSGLVVDQSKVVDKSGIQ